MIVRKERPHPGAQLRFTDVNGHRFTAFATDARRGQLADLELRHRRRARCEDRIRCAKTPGCVTSRCTALTRTRSGASSSPWPANYWPGHRCWPSTAPPGPGNQNGCGCACSAPPGASSAAAAACGCASPPPGPRRPAHRRDHPAAGLRPRLTSQNHPCDQEGQPQAREPRPPGATAGNPARQTLKTATSRSLSQTDQDRETSRLSWNICGTVLDSPVNDSAIMPTQAAASSVNHDRL